ncbi:DUF2306 domain-containing protein [Arthrobacter sp. ISL-69]|uniref:DUF2306 domain-containing protein n=1 Tax=Arthrobacter sp. ISL-69 TaxID=2819113 RepID=UPI001BE86331|nr:DUF2306 domain-containing protein [Arthrobacter sp. ISL-69]MBT2538904.1 DUF2306 domain-containing protein [Arthrobacter sp. ISL-69]
MFRLAFGSAMAASIILGFAAVRHGDIGHHEAWMIRAYDPALGAGTQVFTQGIGNAVFGTSTLSTGLMIGTGWVINVIVAEYAIHRHSSSQTRRAPAEIGF